MSRTVHVPKFLHEIHGEAPNSIGLTMTYLVGAVAAVIAGLAIYEAGYEVWQALLVALLFFDVAGGVVSNFTRSTNSYYQQSKNRRYVFLGLHLLQPLLVALILNDFWGYLIFVAVYTVAGGLIVNAIKQLDMQFIASSVITTVGVLSFVLLGMTNPLLFAFGVLFLIKIVIGFAVRRA